MPRVHLSVGDSSHGPIGYCVELDAPDAKTALEALKARIPEGIDVGHALELPTQPNPVVVNYIRAYFNADALTVEDLVEID